MKTLKKEFGSSKEKKKKRKDQVEEKRKERGKRDIKCMEDTAVCYTRLTPHRDL